MDTLISFAGYSVGVANTKSLIENSIIAHNVDLNAHSDTFVTYSALSSALSTVQGGDYDSDIALINSSIVGLSNRIDDNAAAIAGFSVAYVGTSAPADFNGIFFKIIQ